MKSNRERAERALEALGPASERFRSAVARTMEEIRARLTAGSEARDPEGVDPGLGPLARGRIDTRRFARVFAGEAALDERAEAALRRAMEALAEVDADGEEAFLVELGPGEELAAAARAALGRLGRAFGAARVAEEARGGRAAPREHGDPLVSFPPELWNRAERSVAPPLLVALPGEALRPAALADLLEGAQKLALLVEGEAPPAPLVGLITPSVTVLQTEDPTELAEVAGRDGPGVAVLYPEGSDAASFLHDPAAGGSPGERLTLRDVPGEASLRPVGPIGVFRQREELLQLAALLASDRTSAPATNGSGPVASGGADAGGIEPADRLAAWLLRQANLSGLE